MAERRQNFADWLKNLPPACHTVPLTELAIPGSHQSCTWGLNPRCEVSPDCPPFVQTLSQLFGGEVKKILSKWTVTQDLTLGQQLEAGIRYFDFRLAGKSGESHLYLSHGLYGPNVELCMQEVRTFLENHPKEVVILDFNHFYNVSETARSALLAMLQCYFGPKICPFLDRESMTLEMLWENHLQVIICIHGQIEHDGWIWPGDTIKSIWLNTDNLEKLLPGMEEELKKERIMFCNCQGILTPGNQTILANLTGSLKSALAQKTAPAVAKFLANRRPGQNGINIMSIDFVQLADFIPIVISLNSKIESSSSEEPT